MTRLPEQLTDTVNNDAEPHIGCDGCPVVRDPRGKRPIVTFRRATRVFGLIGAIVLCIPLIAWPMAPKILPSLSPFVAVTIIFAQKSVSWMALLSLPILISAVISRRWFCRYLCPMGVVTDCASRHRHGRRILGRLPNFAPLIVLLTWSGALIGLSLMNWIDPLNIFSAAIGIGKSWTYTGGLILAIVVSLLIPSIWCLKICPLGAVQDLTSRLARTISRTFRPLLPPIHLLGAEAEEKESDDEDTEPWGDEYDDSMFDVKLSELEEGNRELEITAGILDDPDGTKRPAKYSEISTDEAASSVESSPPSTKPASQTEETVVPNVPLTTDPSHRTDLPRPPHARTSQSDRADTNEPIQTSTEDRSAETDDPLQVENDGRILAEPANSKERSSGISETSTANRDENISDENEPEETGLSRRTVLLLIAGVATVAVAAVARIGRGVVARVARLRPPGSVDDSQFLALCIRCGNCEAACPERIIRPSRNLDRPLELGTPIIDFHGDGYCEEACTKCGITCPSGAIRTIGPDEKLQFPIGLASIDSNWCILADNRECKICKRECQYDAIEYIWSDELYTLTPVVDPSKCTGCGRCMASCPADLDVYPGKPEEAKTDKAIEVVVRTGDEIPPHPV